MGERLSERYAPAASAPNRMRWAQYDVWAILPAFLSVCALLYAFLAGLRTVGDPDLGWTLATGRYVVEHFSIPSSDVFSYTAAGREWIYPPFAGVIFYAFFLAGGYAALSWLSAFTAAGTSGLLLAAEPGSGVLAGLCIVAAPIIAVRTAPRANLFTVVLFAAFLNLLWRHHRGRRARLWFLPLLTIAWVNLHLGFIAGLGLLAAYAVLESLEMIRPVSRSAAWHRLRAAAPWLLACLPATLINPWGFRIYTAVIRQNRSLESTAGLIGEWTPVVLNRAAFHDFVSWREPASAFWWLLAATIIAIAACLWKRRIGLALVLFAASAVSFRYVRFQAMFAVVSVVLAGSALSELRLQPGKTARAAAICLVALLAGLVSVRAADLVSDRYYLSGQELSSFGAGESWWFPERAAAFVKRERLPGRIFNSYNAGGFLTWRLPDYPVYIDGRSVPFGDDLFARYLRLMGEPPDSAEWQQEANTRGIQTLILVNTRYPALGAVPLKSYCESRAWVPVYVDDVSAVFLRNLEENRPWIERLRLDCDHITFSAQQTHGRAALYNFYSNAGAALRALGRDPRPAWQQAESLFSRDWYLFLLKGSLLQQVGAPPLAEQEYRRALALRPSEETWFALGHVLAQEARFNEAIECLDKAASYSSAPYRIHQMLAQVYLVMNQPSRALDALDKAESESPYREGAREAGSGFRAELDAARADACWRMGDRARAVQYQERCAAENPEEPSGWLTLAQFYDAVGRSREAELARARATASGR